jgi:hypothetical protein
VDILIYGLAGLAFFMIIKFCISVYHQADEAEYEARFKSYIAKVLHIVKQEQYENMYYWFDADNDKFLAQGKTWEEIVAALKDGFADHIFVLNDTHMIMGPDFEPMIKEEGIIRVAKERVGRV